jgi:gluconokinase
MERVIVVVMGVSGSGKTTIGSQLAARLEVPFVEGDDFHDPAAMEQMAHGHPLTDAQRAPWLDRVNAELRRHDAGVVCACSALDSWSRERLTHGLDDVRIVFLRGDPELLAQRLRAREHHPVGVDLLASQLATLEPPHDANVLELDVADEPDQLVDRAADWLAQARA